MTSAASWPPTRRGWPSPAAPTGGWDASGPRDPQARGIDDGLFVSDVLTAIQARFCVDPGRIAVAGLSNGAGLVGYLACVLAGRIGAFAPVEAEFFQIPGGWHPAHPASIFDVHALTDPVAPYAGMPVARVAGLLRASIPAWLRVVMAADGCRSGPAPILLGVPAADRRAPSAGCQATAPPRGVIRLAAGGHSLAPHAGADRGRRDDSDSSWRIRCAGAPRPRSRA